jgi:hypothetical protein
MSSSRILAPGLLLALRVAEGGPAAPAQAREAPTASIPASLCAIAPDKARPVAAPGREVYCAIDLGSRNVKLAVTSMEPGKPLTLRDERSCRTRLNLGTKVYDAGAPAGRQDKPLASADIEVLAGVINEFRAQCALDGGRMVGADATEWARHATNIEEVKRAVLSRTGIGIEVLTPDEEARYGYIAATRGRTGHVVLDPGSNSFQVTSHAAGEKAPRGVSIPLGYEQAGNLYFAKADSYEDGRRIYGDEVRRRLQVTGLDLAGLRAAVASGKLGRSIVALGQDAAIHLVVGGVLRDASGQWLRDEAAYARKANEVRPTISRDHGEVTAILKAAQIDEYLRSLGLPGQLMQLRADPVRALYGNKALVVPALFDVLMRDLGVDTVVLTPAEMPTGYILAKAAGRH